MSRTSSSPNQACFGIALLAAVSISCASGCSPSGLPVAPVTGTITLDGKPLQGARVCFQPRSAGNALIAGGPSYGETDESGRYELATLNGMRGAVVGEHRVMISTQKKKADPEGTARVIVLAEERVPEAYHNKSTLARTVPEAGLSACDFSLFSDGRGESQ